jgi:hypothetical protein
VSSVEEDGPSLRRSEFFFTFKVTILPMGKSENKDLLKFLRSFPKEQQERALWLRDFVWDLYPTSNELIYDNYNALAFGWSLTDRVGHLFCTIAVGRTSGNVHFGFYFGTSIKDPKKMLLGKGNQYRYILVNDLKAFPSAYMKRLIGDAYKVSMAKVKDKRQLMEGQTITKSVSSSKRAKTKKTFSKLKVGKPKAIKRRSR